MAYPDEGVVKGWRVDWLKGKEDSTEDLYIARRASDWELEECCKILRGEFNYHHLVEPLRAARRPKPPSLKAQALAELELLRGDANAHGLGFDAPAIRRALEQLDG